MTTSKLKKELHSFGLLLRSVPAAVVAPFVVSVFAMNLLANKSIDIPVDWLALDCGIAVSWFAFLAMDIITKHFGPKAACEISLFAIAINLVFCLLMYIGSIIPGTWGAAIEGSEHIINGALDATFGGTWYVLLGSTLAFAASAVINNVLNYAVGKLFKRSPDGLGAFIMRSYVSTAVAQFADNLIFAFAVSHFFFGWSVLQCVTCALTGMLAELLFEAAFSFIGYAVTKKWKKDNVGAEYLALSAAPAEIPEEVEQ